MKRLNLEISLKPFYGLVGEELDQVCLRALRQWDPLVSQAETLSIMFWSSDGSEILEYGGDLDAEMEWARYIGNANPKMHIPSDPDGQCLHSRPYLYRADARPVTYRWVAEVVNAWKRTCVRYCGKMPRIGTTFDPGGEFAPSDFKYKRHREICLADTLGKASFVCCYGVLHADDHLYAGFPKGIPEGTSLGTFLGRQSRLFAADLGFDFLWLSNGFGFGLECWQVNGPLFDGKTFDTARVAEIRGKILGFWKDFRLECPALGLETRGTNLGTGTDLASDATPLREIYEGGFDVEPPPNSPWAALNGDFGIELMGCMSRMAELPPGKNALYRFYVHDPWWLNSPWLDRYARQPHDIYLPLAVSSVDSSGKTVVPEKLSFLTIDDSYGKMPDICPREIIPHVSRAWEERADTAGPLVWIYPFDEIHDLASGERAFHTDWFMREAINDGFPLNTVASTRTLRSEAGLVALRDRILVAPTPFPGATYLQDLLRFVDEGGKLLLYGPIEATPETAELLSRLGLEKAEPLEGAFQIEGSELIDQVGGEAPRRYIHRAVTCGGALSDSLAKGHHGTEAVQGEKRRALTASASPTVKGGLLAWVRGPLPFTVASDNSLPHPDPVAETFPLASLSREMLARLGWTVNFIQHTPTRRHPIVSVHRQANAFLISTYSPDLTVTAKIKTAWGAPVLLDSETTLDAGSSSHVFPRAQRRECRVFLRQATGTISCREEISCEIGITRRCRIIGLNEGTLVFFPPAGAVRVTFQNDTPWPHIIGPFVEPRNVSDANGCCLEIGPVSGSVLISW